MRTKILLASAAALVMGLATSNAQVYSANVVGYVTLTTPANANAALENPLDDGNNNVLTNVLANAPKGTVVQVWNGAGFDSASRSLFGAGTWSGTAIASNITPGVGFFIKTPSAFTNVFIGSVIPLEYATNNANYTAGLQYLVGSSLPVSGTITNSVDQGVNTLNLGSSMPPGSVVQIYNGNGFDAYSRSLFGAHTWNGNPTINVGQSFFLKGGGSGTVTWSQALQ